MKKVDYHLHTDYSMDCKMRIDALCEAAIRSGVSEICITDHTEFGHPQPSADQPPNIKKWSDDIEAARKKYNQLEIRKGIEIGDNPRDRARIKAWHSALDVDFLLLSLHLVNNQDPYWPEFFEGRAMEVVYREYVEAKLESALAWSATEYDAFAHLGYCAKFAPYPMEERPLRWRHAPDALDQLFKRLAQCGKPLEINSSGMRVMGESIPGEELLRRFRELGGEVVTIGSDAHRPEHVGYWIEEAQCLAKSCGFRYQATFSKREMTPIPL